MKKTKERSEKKTYRSPLIEQIPLDNEISLALASPENLPVWSENKGNLKNDPLKTNMG